MAMDYTIARAYADIRNVLWLEGWHEGRTASGPGMCDLGDRVRVAIGADGQALVVTGHDPCGFRRLATYRVRKSGTVNLAGALAYARHLTRVMEAIDCSRWEAALRKAS